MKTKTLQKESINFLNNQNYILGKTEKKKLLSKFFIERSIKVFFKLIWFYYILFIQIYLFIF